MFKSIELQKIADWCNEREMLPNRVVILDVKAACRSLGVFIEHSVSNEEIKEIESLMLKQ